jgi:hypothetical protein
MPTSEMIRRLVHLWREVIVASPSDEQDHRHADTFGWHRSQQDYVPSGGVALGSADKVLVRKKSAAGLHREHAELADRLGGLLRRSLPRPSTAEAGAPRCTADCSPAREAIREVQQERLRRCGRFSGATLRSLDSQDFLSGAPKCRTRREQIWLQR